VGSGAPRCAQCSILVLTSSCILSVLYDTASVIASSYLRSAAESASALECVRRNHWTIGQGDAALRLRLYLRTVVRQW